MLTWHTVIISGYTGGRNRVLVPNVASPMKLDWYRDSTHCLPGSCDSPVSLEETYKVAPFCKLALATLTAAALMRHASRGAGGHAVTNLAVKVVLRIASSLCC